MMSQSSIEQVKINNQAKEQTVLLKEIKNILDSKEDKTQVEKLVDKFKNYSTLKELKGLYNKVMPQLQNFEEVLQEYQGDHQQFKKMLARYDEILATKSNKTSLLELEHKVNSKFANKNDLWELNVDFNKQLQENKGIQDKLTSTMDHLNENLSKDIHTAVRKVAKQMEGQASKRK